MNPPRFDRSEFEALKRVQTKKDVEVAFKNKIVKEMIPWLNRTKLAEIPDVRHLWVEPRSKVAFSDSVRVFANFNADSSLKSAGWYIFNNGGRSELQFNIGMDQRWFGVGLAFHLGAEKFGDPQAVKGLFNEFKHAVRTTQADFERFILTNRIEIDWSSENWKSDGQIPSRQLMNFLFTTPVPTSWIFIGKILRPDKKKDATILGDPVKLNQVMTTVLEGLWPYYLKAQRWGHGFTVGKHPAPKRPGTRKGPGLPGSQPKQSSGSPPTPGMGPKSKKP